MNKIEATLEILVSDKNIPVRDYFQVTEGLITKYITTYSELSSGNKKFDGRYARKLAGINLLKLNFLRGAKSTDVDAGLIYLISNPVFPEHYKIGMTIDLTSRLSSYQTYDPYRKFEVSNYDFVLDRRKAESIILKSNNISLEQGEWALKENCLMMLRKVVELGY